MVTRVQWEHEFVRYLIHNSFYFCTLCVEYLSRVKTKKTDQRGSGGQSDWI